MRDARSQFLGGAAQGDWSRRPHLGSRINADLAIPGTGDMTLGYNRCMAKAGRAKNVPLRGCGSLSPLYDEALTWAAGLHRHQLRKNTRVAYIAHLIAVSSLVLEDGGTETEAIAGLLHDAVEDCGAQVEPILRHRFGDAVVDIVVECSDAAPVHGEQKPMWSIRKQAYVDHFRTTATDSAVRISAADKLHNARATLSDLRESDPIGTWTRHNACHHQSLWYYQAISDTVTSRLPKSRTGVELAKVVTELYAQTGGGVEQPASAQWLVPACTDPKCTPAEVPSPRQSAPSSAAVRRQKESQT
jgi:HD domain